MATKSSVDKLTQEIRKANSREWFRPFLVQLAETPNVSQACAIAGVSRQAAYVARENDEAFAAAWDACVNKAVDRLEQVAFQRAEDGSDTLAIFLLKAHRPEKYREANRMEITGAGGKPVEITPVPMDDARLIEVARSLAQALPEGIIDGDDNA